MKFCSSGGVGGLYTKPCKYVASRGAGAYRRGIIVGMGYHDSFVKFDAENNFDLGVQMGTHFSSEIQNRLDSTRRDKQWQKKRERAKEYLAATTQYLPQYVREMEGYAHGAKVDFLDLWAESLEDDEFDRYRTSDHCTSVVTNNGMLVSHNEDWAPDAANRLSVVQKTIGQLTIFELNYLTTLGGNSASVNSHGYVQLINSLTHTDWQMGVPHNVVARFMSETSDPEADFRKLATMQRATGYNHNLISLQGQVWNIESTAKKQVLTRPSVPFVHTNHYLAEELKEFEATTSSSTHNRYETAIRLVEPMMSIEGIKQLTGNASDGSDLSIFNERTIGRMVVNLAERVAHIWLRREAEKGWVEYPLDFIN